MNRKRILAGIAGLIGTAATLVLLPGTAHATTSPGSWWTSTQYCKDVQIQGQYTNLDQFTRASGFAAYSSKAYITKVEVDQFDPYLRGSLQFPYKPTAHQVTKTSLPTNWMGQWQNTSMEVRVYLSNGGYCEHSWTIGH